MEAHLRNMLTDHLKYWRVDIIIEARTTAKRYVVICTFCKETNVSKVRTADTNALRLAGWSKPEEIAPSPSIEDIKSFGCPWHLLVYRSRKGCLPCSSNNTLMPDTRMNMDSRGTIRP
jgi:hypothetical protein